MNGRCCTSSPDSRHASRRSGEHARSRHGRPLRSVAMAEQPQELADATRRTRLANERTYLAWWRSGLTAYAVAVGFGRIVPSITHETRWPYTVAGIGYAIIGTIFIVYGALRHRHVEDALQRGNFSSPDRRFLVGLAGVGVALGLLTVALTALGE